MFKLVGGSVILKAKILLDSSAEIIANDKEFSLMENIPFKLYVDDKEYVDDENLCVENFVADMRTSKSVPRSACPSPQDFLDKFEGFDAIFVVTISAALSGVYNSASLAKKMYLEEHPDVKIHIFDSKSASIGETLIGLKIRECILNDIDFDETVDIVDKYIESQQTFFISECLDNLVKNGRISRLKSKIVTALNIKPIMGSTPEGQIKLFKKARGENKAVQTLADMIKEMAVDEKNKILAISHCENLPRAELLRDEILKRCNFKNILILQTKGLSSLYVDYQGIILAF